MKIKLSLYIAVAALFLSSSVAHAFPWSWDLFTQKSHRAQESPAPKTPEGVVTTKGKPYFAAERDDAQSLKNPFPATKKSIARGKTRFERFCLVCHGQAGAGDGPVGKKFVQYSDILPTPLNDDYVRTKPDGDIYFTITNGGLYAMPSYSDAVPKDDRWHIINYIKNGLDK